MAKKSHEVLSSRRQYSTHFVPSSTAQRVGIEKHQRGGGKLLKTLCMPELIFTTIHEYLSQVMCYLMQVNTSEVSCEYMLNIFGFHALKMPSTFY